jgi:hypothetical protein
MEVQPSTGLNREGSFRAILNVTIEGWRNTAQQAIPRKESSPLSPILTGK